MTEKEIAVTLPESQWKIVCSVLGDYEDEENARLERSRAEEGYRRAAGYPDRDVADYPAYHAQYEEAIRTVHDIHISIVGQCVS